MFAYIFQVARWVWRVLTIMNNLIYCPAFPRKVSDLHTNVEKCPREGVKKLRKIKMSTNVIFESSLTEDADNRANVPCSPTKIRKRKVAPGIEFGSSWLRNAFAFIPRLKRVHSLRISVTTFQHIVIIATSYLDSGMLWLTCYKKHSGISMKSLNMGSLAWFVARFWGWLIRRRSPTFCFLSGNGRTCVKHWLCSRAPAV